MARVTTTLQQHCPPVEAEPHLVQRALELSPVSGHEALLGQVVVAVLHGAGGQDGIQKVRDLALLLLNGPRRRQGMHEMSGL